ncbi:DUF3040 domain-containing protein [Mumia sp. zg.B53]|uniref:DUF3040 domain-containing protein n=1 Tax=unclassified Mumia TaxID=2621872 RepID=UPI001C6EFFEE|nr:MULTISPECIES: DUF3040 domain-containing protein [unclassified Mumia]MBW9206246.1 DUF3040 domain-containing protein [Mumia sp. zg.B17]MBW9211460.1 DUF3040 domain-containing protein [Mumia sp. zg.B21]MBW9216633.1 DUF3040 domain-containing protein [Mumia sp. zg.B53]MDD9350314.1 DUF3040 domain-containing protein [Mumia sp.]
MPLSEEEQRLLEQLEQALAAEDPRLASTLRGSKLRARARRIIVLASIGFVAGVAMLMIGVIAASTPVGVAGFALMVAGAYFFLTTWRSRDVEGPDESTQTAPPRPKQGSGSTSDSFMHRMEERWRRRRDDSGS